MAQPLRKFEIGGIYHVFNRGYDKRQIFLEDRDYLRFIESLYYFNDKETTKIRDVKINHTGQTRVQLRDELRAENWKPIVEILAFTLMPNHYHMILREIVPGGITIFMKKLGDGYTGYFNTKYNRVGLGGLFQSRYKSVRVKNDDQLSNLFAYVHTNPVELKEPRWKDFEVRYPIRAKRFLEDYWQSSYLDYIGKSNFGNVISNDFFLKLYGNEGSCRQAVEDWVAFKGANRELGLKFRID